MSPNRRRLLALSGALLASLSGCLSNEPQDRGNGSQSDDGTDSDDAVDQSHSDTDREINPNASDSRIEPDVATVDTETLIEGNTAFAFQLYNRFSEENPETNQFFSPFSIAMALAMTWAGARADTEADRDQRGYSKGLLRKMAYWENRTTKETMNSSADPYEMADALSFSLDQETLHPAFNALDRDLESRSELDNDLTEDTEQEEGDPLELEIANALWPRHGLTLREEYLETVTDHYGVRPVEVDYSNPSEASEIINGWVADETEDRITDLVSEETLRPDTALVLTNAIYFLAEWLKEFDEEETSDMEFTALNGETGEVAMMSQAERFPYANVDGHQVIELPYVGEETSMVVMLPADGEFESFEDELDSDRFGELAGELESTHGRIELPRFEVETSVSLVKHLQTLGMEEAFTEAADFSGMVEGGGLAITDVLHVAIVSVDEDGTEAAAATAVVMNESRPPEEQFEMTVDRPFFFMIRDRLTESLLFLGRVVDVPDDPDD